MTACPELAKMHSLLLLQFLLNPPSFHQTHSIPMSLAHCLLSLLNGLQYSGVLGLRHLLYSFFTPKFKNL